MNHLKGLSRQTVNFAGSIIPEEEKVTPKL
jgi:hypothetical protein